MRKKNAKTWSIFPALSGIKNYENRNNSKAGCWFKGNWRTNTTDKRRLHNWKLLTFALARKGIKSLTVQFLVLMTPEGGKQVCQGFKRSVPWRTCNILRPCMRGKAENLFLQSTTCSCLLTCLTLQSKRLSSSAWLKLKFRAFQARLKSFATRIVTIANCVWVLNFPKEGEVSPCARTLLRAIPSAGATPATPPN